MLKMQNLLITFIDDSKKIIEKLENELSINSKDDDYSLEQFKVDIKEIDFRKDLLSYAIHRLDKMDKK